MGLEGLWGGLVWGLARGWREGLEGAGGRGRGGAALRAGPWEAVGGGVGQVGWGWGPAGVWKGCGGFGPSRFFWCPESRAFG